MFANVWKAVKGYFEEFKILKLVPREFWSLNLIINFFEMLAYFSFITVLTLYLTNNVGFDDTETGDIVGVFTLMITVIIFFAGPVIDTIGIKRALVISMAILIPTRFFLGTTDYIERKHLEAHVNPSEIIPDIKKGNFDKLAFTQRPDVFASAQAEMVFASKGKKNPTQDEIDALDKAPEKLRKGMLDLLAKNNEIRSRWEDKLRQKLDKKLQAKLKEDVNDPLVAQKIKDIKKSINEGWSGILRESTKDTKVYKKLVAEMLEKFPEVRSKYIYDLSSLSGDKLKEAVVNIVLSFNELRAKHSLQSTLKLLVLIALFFIAFGEALMVPAIYVAVRRFTNKRTSGTGFNFQYLSMNVAAVMAGGTIDLMRGYFGYIEGNEAIMLAGAAFAVICTIAAIKLRTNLEFKDDGEIIYHENDRYTTSGEENPISIMKDVMVEKRFWQFMFFLILLIGVRLVFTHQFMVMPKYYERVLGHDAPIGRLNMINPAIIVIGLILFIPIVAKFDIFKLIVVGTFVSALSVFALVIPGKWVAELLNTTIENGYFTIIMLQIIIFAIGEVIWSPRLSEYTVTIAPKGKEGTYMSLASLPMFIAKPLNGALSGRLLEHFCPPDVMEGIVSGARTFVNGPEMMWLIFGIIAISSPILVLVFRNVIRPKDEDNGTTSTETNAEATA